MDPEVPPDDLPDLRGQLFPPGEICEGTEELVDAELLAGDDVEDVELLGEHVLAVTDEGLLVQLCSRKELCKTWPVLDKLLYFWDEVRYELET